MADVDRPEIQRLLARNPAGNVRREAL